MKDLKSSVDVQIGQPSDADLTIQSEADDLAATAQAENTDFLIRSSRYEAFKKDTPKRRAGDKKD